MDYGGDDSRASSTSQEPGFRVALRLVMLIELRLPRSHKGVDESIAVVTSFIRAASAGGEPLTDTKLLCDWVQYRNNFRFPVVVREVLDPAATLRREIAVDLKRVGADVSDDRFASVLGNGSDIPSDSSAMEQWVPLSRSCIWRFNALYWQELALWEKQPGMATNRRCPGGGAAERIGRQRVPSSPSCSTSGTVLLCGGLCRSS